MITERFRKTDSQEVNKALDGVVGRLLTSQGKARGLEVWWENIPRITRHGGKRKGLLTRHPIFLDTNFSSFFLEYPWKLKVGVQPAGKDLLVGMTNFDRT